MPLTVFAPAKLNLCLHVVGRRADGYHLLESLVAFTDCADALCFEPGEGITLRVEGEFAEASGDDINNNLVMRAARALQQHSKTRLGATITLTKNIPVGAGLGGGSADAAATLHALNQLWQLHLSLDALLMLGAPLGADIAMCLHSKPLIARGIGEIIDPCAIVLPPMHAVLVYPRTTLLSVDVYRTLAAMRCSRSPAMALVPERFEASHEVVAWLAGNTCNDLQQPAIAMAPVVAEVLSAMESTVPAPTFIRMTGSGACCFALFASADQSAAYADIFAKNYPQWWVHACSIRE